MVIKYFMVWDMVISMMTEGEFWDKFHKKHNPGFQYGTKKIEKKITKKKTSRTTNAAKRHPVFKVPD